MRKKFYVLMLVTRVHTPGRNVTEGRHNVRVCVQCGLSLGGRVPCGDGDLVFCMLVSGGEGFYSCFCSLARVSKIAFGNMVWLSFRWLLAADSARMWNLSGVLRWVPFLWKCSTCMMLCMGPNEWQCRQCKIRAPQRLPSVLYKDHNWNIAIQ